MMSVKYGKPSDDFAEIRFGDKRLTKRLVKTVSSMTERMQDSILSACGTRHDAKSFYALLSNEKFTRVQLHETAQQGTITRIKESGITEVLLPQDTADINLHGHKKTEGLGYSSNHTKGVQIHSCLALTPEGMALGLLHQSYGTRETKKISLTAEEKKQRPIEEKESHRWLETAQASMKVIPENVTPIIICDREGDFYELYAEMMTLEASFVVRLVQDRVTESGEHSMQQLRRTKGCGEVEVCIPRDTRKSRPARSAKMEVAFCSVVVCRPKRVCKELPKQLVMTLVRITEIGETEDPIEWLLATNISVANADEVMKIVGYYVHRWKIERFHYVLNSGCQVEKIQQRTYERILSMLLIYSVIAIYILAMTYAARVVPDCPCDVFLDEDEWKILYRLITREKSAPREAYSLKTAIAYLGELGGFKHSPSDGVYGAKAIWKGLTRLYDAIDFHIRLVGQV